MYKSYQLKNYDNSLKTTALALIYISDFIFIYFILKTVKKSLGKLAVSAKIIGGSFSYKPARPKSSAWLS